MYQKKFVAALMVLAMLCAGLSGCFRPNASDPTESTTGRNPVQTLLLLFMESFVLLCNLLKKRLRK